MTSAPALTLRPYATRTFAAFRVTESNRTYPVTLHTTPGSLEAALNEALTRTLLCHKETLILRETDEDGAVSLHLYAIKRRSRPDYVHENHVTRAVHRLYAEKLAVVDGAVLG